MSVEISTASSVGANFVPGTVNDGTSETAYLWAYRDPAWLGSVVRKMLDRLSKGDAHVVRSANSALSWIRHLPGGMPEPSVGVGDDSSVSVEWDRGGSTLHVLFEGQVGEVYFSDSNGDEFETPLGAGDDKVRAAVVKILYS